MDQVKQKVLDAVGSNERQIILKKEYLTDKQKACMEWEKCYKGQLFAEKSRVHPWGTQVDVHSQTPVDRSRWKPIYVPSIAKDMVKSLSSYITGKDKFPSILVSSTEHLFEGLDPPPGYEDDAKSGQIKAQAEALQVFANEVLNQADLLNAVHAALREALIKEDSALMVRYYDGSMWLSVPDRNWCSWEYSNDHPDQLAIFREVYFFTRENDLDEKGNKIEYLYFREITQTQWIEHEIPLEPDKSENGAIGLGEPIVIFEGSHGFTFCPAVVFENTDRESIYANEVMDNIRGYIEYVNDQKAGIIKNMNPQWVILREDGDSHLQARAPGDEDKPLERGRLWELTGKSVQSFSNGTEGFEMAVKDSESQRQEIRSSASIIDIPDDNEQSGRALALRLSPHYSHIDRLRGSIGKAIVETVEKLLLGAQSRIKDLKLPDSVARPRSLTGIQVALDWGTLMPVTPEIVGQEFDNVAKLQNMGYISKKSGMSYSLPLVNIEDVDAEMRLIEADKQKDDEDQINLAKAAFSDMNEEEDDG